MTQHESEATNIVPTSMRARIEMLRQRRHRLEQGGGPERIARQHQAGKLTARERIHLLIEPETFQELFLFLIIGVQHLGWPVRRCLAKG